MLFRDTFISTPARLQQISYLRLAHRRRLCAIDSSLGGRWALPRPCLAAAYPPSFRLKEGKQDIFMRLHASAMTLLCHRLLLILLYGAASLLTASHA